jgi:hypothetical protein
MIEKQKAHDNLDEVDNEALPGETDRLVIQESHNHKFQLRLSILFVSS